MLLEPTGNKRAHINVWTAGWLTCRLPLAVAVVACLHMCAKIKRRRERRGNCMAFMLLPLPLLCLHCIAAVVVLTTVCKFCCWVGMLLPMLIVFLQFASAPFVASATVACRTGMAKVSVCAKAGVEQLNRCISVVQAEEEGPRCC